MLDWIDNDGTAHPLDLSRALRDYNTLLGIYTSGLERRSVDLPFEPRDNLIGRMKEILQHTESG